MTKTHALSRADRSGRAHNTTRQLSEADLRKVQELKKRDREVRAHEAAHLAAAGKYATGGATFKYERAPDGRSYAVGGEVKIDTSPVPNDPQATIRKARQIKAAALAPADPSSADRRVAASAAQMEAKARQEVFRQRLEESDNRDNPDDASGSIESDENSAAAPAGTGQIASSTYRAVHDYSLSESNTASLLELTA